MIGRRGFLIGGGLLLAMPAVVRAESLMPVHALRPVDFQLVDLLRGTQVDLEMQVFDALSRPARDRLNEHGGFALRVAGFMK